MTGRSAIICFESNLVTSKWETELGNTISDTRIESPSVSDGHRSPRNRGCLLQIYPASGVSEVTRLEQSRTLLGRDPECGITVDDSSVSRVHAAIEAKDDGYYLLDLKSTNGTWIEDSAVTEPWKLQGGELIRLGNTILKFMQALDQEAQYYAVVHELMTRDSLTNTFNRGYLIPFIKKALDRCRSRNESLSLILLDIDRFKRVNDRHGHLVGDEVLRILCERVRRQLRNTDVAARYGGDEFVIVCPNTGLQVAVHLAERVQKSLASESFQTQAGSLKVTCSMGVTATDGHSKRDFDAILSAADRLLYLSKSEGRDCLHGAEGSAAAAADELEH